MRQNGGSARLARVERLTGVSAAGCTRLVALAGGWRRRGPACGDNGCDKGLPGAAPADYPARGRLMLAGLCADIVISLCGRQTCGLARLLG